MALTLVNGPMTVGERIAQARKDKDMTQHDLSSRLGISRAAVGQWEVNATSPSISTLENVAEVLDVSPQYLAFNTAPGDVRVVYRNPERDNITWLPEITFGEQVTDEVEGTRWGVPFEYLKTGLHTDPENTIICMINSHAVEPDYEYGDKVFVNKTENKPSPAGIFAYWDGFGLAFAKLQSTYSATPTVKISAKGVETIEVPFSELAIIGRVKGRIHRE